MRRFALAACLVATAVLVVGCSIGGWGVVRKLGTGRLVGVSSDRRDRWMWVESGSESTTARIGPRVVTVEPTRIEVDGEFVATIDEATKSVAINEHVDGLEIYADAKAVYEEPFTSQTASAPVP